MSAARDFAVSHSRIEAFLRAIAAQVRRRRAKRAALRGAFWGAVAAAAILAAKAGLGDLAIPIALAAIGALALTGALLSAIRRVTPFESARLADRAFGLHDRLVTTLECAAATQRSPLADALVADTEARVQALDPRSILRLGARAEARLLAIPLLIALVLAWAPPIPRSIHWWPEAVGSNQDAVRNDALASNVFENSAQSLTPERDPSEMANAAVNAAGASQAIAGGLPQSFKDKTLAKLESDFSSFVRKGDDRLRMLEHADRLPDLQTDHSASQNKRLISAGDLLASQRASGLSADKLGKLLKELADLGKKNSAIGNEANAGIQALDEDRIDEAFDSMQNALEKLRESDPRRNAKSLSGSAAKAGASDKIGKGTGEEDWAKGNAAERLRSTPYTAGLQGLRSGRAQSLETKLTGRAGAGESQLRYLGVIGEYKKIMEEAITQEQVPRDYQDQVRNYFKALGQR